MEKKTLNINATITVNSLAMQLSDLCDEEKCELAVELGLGGDLNYEFMLLSKLIKIINDNYGADPDMDILCGKLLNLKPEIESLLKNN